MKISKFSALAIMLLGLSSCQKEIEKAAVVGSTNQFDFTVYANAQGETKTEYNEDETAIVWSEDDAISLSYAEAGTSNYTDGTPFVIEDPESGKFNGKLPQKLDASKSYDWCAIYPYSSTSDAVSIGSAADEAQVQVGNDSKAHLTGAHFPLYGKAANVEASASPSLAMHQVASVIRVNVTNSSDRPLTVESISFTGTEDIVGSYTLDVTGGQPVITSGETVSSTARLTVQNATALEKGQTAAFYIGIKPFTAPSGSFITVTVNGYEKAIDLTKDVTFSPGKIKTINLDYNKTYSYKKVSAIAPGTYLIVVHSQSGSYYAFDASLDLYKNKVSPTNDVIASSASVDAAAVELSEKNGKYFIKTSKGYLYTVSGSAPNVAFSSTADDSYLHDVAVGATGVTFKNKAGRSTEYYLNYGSDSGTYGFRYYSSATEFELYRLEGATSSKQDRNLKFAQAEVTKKVGDAPFTNALSGNTAGVVYTSSNEAVATVDASGEITVVGAGTATITAAAEATATLNAGSAQFTITVEKVQQTLAFAQAEVSYEMASGSFSVPALSGAKTAVTYSSDDANVAVVNASTGAVTIKAAGTATITAKAAESEQYLAGTASYKITVTKAPQTLSFDQTAVSYDMASGSFTAPTLSGAKTAVAYSSNRTSVAEVNATTGAVTIKAKGSVTITATAAESEQYLAGTASYIITVTNSAAPPVIARYEKVMSSSEIENNGTYIIVFDNGSSSKVFKPIYSNGAFASENTANAINAVVTDSTIEASDAIDACQVILEANTNSANYYYIRVPKAYNGTDYYFVLNNGSATFQAQTERGNSSEFAINAGVLTMSRNQNGSVQYMYYSTYSSFFKAKNSEAAEMQLALYKYVERAVTPLTGKTFKKVSSITSGKKYVIVDGTTALKNDNGTDVAYSVAGKVSGNTLTVPEEDAEAITWTAGTNNNFTAQGSITLKNGSYYLARGNTSVNNDVVLVTTVNGYAVWSFDGQNLNHKNSSGAYTFHVFYDGSRWNAEQQSATNNITIYEEN